jgi:lysophospholipase L1-like esterase
VKARVLLVLTALAVGFVSAELADRAYWAWRRRFSPADDGRSFSLYVVGESTAAGQPYDHGLTLAGMISRQFAGGVAGRKIRVFQLARSGESIYPQSVEFERALRSRGADAPGAVLVYAGHNDATFERGRPAFELLRERVLSRSQALTDLLFLAEKRFPLLRARTLDTYEYDLSRVIELSLSRGLTPILAESVSDRSDLDPGLLAGPEVSRAGATALLRVGLDLEAKKRYREAARYYSREAAARPPYRTYLNYRAAKCLQALGRYDAAKALFAQIVDSCPADDFGRATDAQNEIVRRLARRHSIPLVETVTLFAARSPHGVVGRSLFSDGQHPNMDGYILLAEGYAEKISAVFGEPIRRRFSGPEDVYREFSFGKGAQAVALVSSGNWLFSSAARQAFPDQRLAQARDHYLRALALDPDDFSAWLGLGLADAARRRGLLPGTPVCDWLARHDLLFKVRYEVSRAQLLEITPELAADGVAPSIVANILRTLPAR